jgi:hypothetical protein
MLRNLKKSRKNLRQLRVFYLSVMNFDEKAFGYIYGVIAFWLFFYNQTCKAN